MKIFIYVIGFIVSCFLGFYLIGLVKPTITYESVIIVNRPVKQSWKIFSDESLMNQWVLNFDKIEHIKSNPFEKGAEYNIYLKEKNNSFKLNHEVTECTPSKSYSYILSNAVLRNNVSISFSEPKEYTTEIKITNKVVAENWFLRSLFVFFKSKFKSQDDVNLEALKKLIEMDLEN